MFFNIGLTIIKFVKHVNCYISYFIWYNFTFQKICTSAYFSCVELCNYFLGNKPGFLDEMIDNEMYMVYDGTTKYFEGLYKFKDKNILLKKKEVEYEDLVLLWDFETNQRIITNYTISDLIKSYKWRYKVKDCIKSKIVKKSREEVYIVITDIIKSTEMWLSNRFSMAKCIIEHDKIARQLLKKNNGIELRNEGDSILAMFFNKAECKDFVFEFQRQASKILFDEQQFIQVRIAVNYGSIECKSFSNPNLFGQIIEDIYKIVSHTKPNCICLKNVSFESNKQTMFCFH